MNPCGIQTQSAPNQIRLHTVGSFPTDNLAEEGGYFQHTMLGQISQSQCSTRPDLIRYRNSTQNVLTGKYKAKHGELLKDSLG